MGKGCFKCKYALIFIILLFAFISGLNYKQLNVTNNLAVKRISIVYSISKNEKGNGNFEELLYQEFRKLGIEVEFDRFYLDCNRLNAAEEIEHISKYLELLNNKSVDIILTVGDQATYSLLSTRHKLLSSLPLIACNVNFPDEKLIGEYDLSKRCTHIPIWRLYIT